MSNVGFDPRNFAPDTALNLAAAFGIKPSTLRSDWGQLLADSVIPSRYGSISRITLEQVERSEIDGFIKLLFSTPDELKVESVLIPLHNPKKFSLCISSQVGCVMGCTFCATARMPVRRNLETWEIVDQFIHARAVARQYGRDIGSVVFMGMGEPFLNYDRVISAAKLFCYPTKGAISGKAITVSTVGLVKEIDKFTQQELPFRLSISLGAPTDEKRALLVPVAARTPVAEVMAAARRHALARNDRVNIAYVCVGKVNTTLEDAVALGELIQDTPVRLDLIDVKDNTGRYLPPSEEELSLFRDALRRYVGQPVVRRYSGGSDIRAGCGMLAGA